MYRRTYRGRNIGIRAHRVDDEECLVSLGLVLASDDTGEDVFLMDFIVLPEANGDGDV